MNPQEQDRTVELTRPQPQQQAQQGQIKMAGFFERPRVPSKQVTFLNKMKLASNTQASLFERRQAVRLTWQTAVKYRPSRDSAVWRHGWTKDLSATGAKLALTGHVAVGDDIELLVTVPGIDEPKSLSGRVVWETHDQFQRHCGVHFDKAISGSPSKWRSIGRTTGAARLSCARGLLLSHFPERKL